VGSQRRFNSRIALSCALDQPANILNPPGGDSRAELNGLGKPARPDAIPPGRFAHRDRVSGPDNAGQAKKASEGNSVMLRHAAPPSDDDGVLNVSMMAVTEFSYDLAEFGMTKPNSVIESDNARSRVR
jgi:hypothetical protein